MFEKLQLFKHNRPSRTARCCAPITDRFVHILGFRISLLSLLSYILDWFIYAIIALIAAGLSFTEPLLQDFDLQNRNLWHSYFPEPILMIPFWALIIMAAIIPLVIAFIFSIFSIWNWPTKLWDYHIYSLGLLGCVSIQFLLVTIFKNATGKPRPDFIQRCIPFPFIPAPNTLANIAVCSNPNLLILWDGFKSFPSEHASAMFASATFHFLFNAGRFRIFDGRGLSWRTVISGIPLVMAGQVSCLSISDHRSFLEDVVAGAVIGSFVGWVFYRMYFPSVFDIENGGKAYPPRRFGIPFYYGRNTQFYPFEHEMVVSSNFNEKNALFIPAGIPPASISGPTTTIPRFTLPTPVPKVIVNVKRHPNHSHIATEVTPDTNILTEMGPTHPSNLNVSNIPMVPLAPKYQPKKHSLYSQYPQERCDPQSHIFGSAQ